MANVAKSNLENMTGIPSGNACVVLIRTEWNSNIVDELERGCLAKLKEYGVQEIETVTVPGAVEIPFAIKNFWTSSKKNHKSGKKPKKPDAFIALACVIRGDTPHFEYVCQAVTEGVLQLNLILPVPTIYGVLTVENEEQARQRIGGIHGHKGEEAALTALKMIQLIHPRREKNKPTQK